MTTLTPRENTLLAHIALHQRTYASPGRAKDAADLWSIDETGKPAQTSTRYTLLHRLRDVGHITIGDLHAGARRITLTETGWNRAVVAADPDHVATRYSVAHLTRVLTDHLYCCDQAADPCSQSEPAPGETWHDLAARRAGHLAELIHETVLGTPRGGAAVETGEVR